MERHFPGETSCDELAEELLKRIRCGELNLVIACDRIPYGLPDVISGIAAQNALGFDLDLVEVVPYVREVADTAEIIFVPSTRLATVTVARTAVTVTYRQGDAQPSTSVKVTSLEDVAEGIRIVGDGRNPNSRPWSPESVEEQVHGNGKPAAVRLLEFAKYQSVDGKHIAEGEKVSPSFGFYVRGKVPAGSTATRMIFKYNVGTGRIRVYLNSAEGFVGPQLTMSLRERLRTTFGDEIDVTQMEPSLSLDSYARNADEFEQTMLWFKQEVARVATQ